MAAILLIVLTGCAGSMKGVVRQDARRIEVTYTDGRIGKGVLQTVLPDGERFEGRIVKIGATEIQTGSAVTDNGSANFEDVNLFDGNAEATLTGNKGNIMKCRFNLADSIIGLSSGGFGICQDSRGRVVDIFF